MAAKEKIKAALDHHLRDLFSFKPDLVLYDITSTYFETYFEGAGPAGLAKHGHGRDGKPHNVQVIVAVVMVAGWPIAHHVWADNEVDHTTGGKAIADLHRRFGFNRLGRVDNSWVNLRRLGNQLGGILEPFVLVIILS